MIVGLTGGIGSGKSTVLNFFKEFENVAVYMADVEAKNLMNTSAILKEKLIKKFGADVFQNNTLNTHFLSNIVFKNKEKIQALNAIVHPEVAKHFREFVKMNQEKAYVLYENAILFETNNNQFCDCIITVFTSLEVRISRILQRDHTSREAVLDRIRNQFSDDIKTLQSHYVIENNSLKATKQAVHRIHKFLT